MDIWQIALRIGVGVLRRRKVMAIMIFLGVLGISAPAAYYLSQEPPRYKTSATILLEARPDRLPLFQEFSPFRPLPVQLAILRSRSMAEGVLENLPKSAVQDLVDSPYHVDYALRGKNAFRRLMGAEPEVESPQRRALKELQQARTAFVSKGDGIVEIGAEASRPQAAIDIVNTYIEVLLSRTRTFNLDDARVSREYLEQQVADVRKSVKASEEGLRSFTQTHGGVKIPEQHQAVAARLAQSEHALAEIEANRRIVQARLVALRDKVATEKSRSSPVAAVPPAPVPVPRPTSPEIQRLRDQLGKLESALLDLRAKYTEVHPRVVLVKEQIGEMQRQLGEAVKEAAPVRPAPAAVLLGERVDFSEQVVVLETSLHALSAQEEALRRQAQELRQSLGGLSRNELEYGRLTREAESNRNLYAMLSDKLTAARIREQGEMKVVKVIDPPGPPITRTSEKQILFLALALGLAILVGAGVPGAVEWRRRVVETEDDVETATGLAVLGRIPRLRSQRPMFVTARELEKLGGSRRLREVVFFSEASRALRVNIQLAARTECLRTVMLTSAHPGEGKSTVLVNLGLAFCEVGTRVVLADTDFQRPTLHRTLSVPQSEGLVDALQSDRDVSEALTLAREGLWVAPRGPSMKPSVHGMLATSRLGELLEGLRGRADLVLCDSSPVLMFPENLFLASAVDGVVLVVKAGVTPCRDLARAKALLESAGARLVGVVINQTGRSHGSNSYRRYYAYAEKAAG